MEGNMKMSKEPEMKLILHLENHDPELDDCNNPNYHVNYYKYTHRGKTCNVTCRSNKPSEEGLQAFANQIAKLYGKYRPEVSWEEIVDGALEQLTRH
jgi:hypothetical protein